MQTQKNTQQKSWLISKDHVPKTLTSSYVHRNMPPDTTHIDIPETVTSIGNNAFKHCDRLQTITIPDTVTSIGHDAFTFCQSLQTITIPNTVTSIGEDAFSWCTHLSTITIPNSVTSLGKAAFDNCHSLESAIISNQLTCIEEYTFNSCKRLVRVVLPNDLLHIKSFAFYNCKSLQTIEIPAKVTRIGEGAFYGCSNLQSANLSSQLTHIDGHAFYQCNNLKNIVIPGSVTWIGDQAFTDCSKLNLTLIPGQPTEFGNAPCKCASAVLPDALCTPEKKNELGLWKHDAREFVQCTPFSVYAREFVITSLLKDASCKHNDSSNDRRDACQEKLFQNTYSNKENISLYRLCNDPSFQPSDLKALNHCSAIDVVRAIRYRHNNLSLPSTDEDTMPSNENECESMHFLRCVMGSRFITASLANMIEKDPNLEYSSLVTAMIENTPDLEGPSLHLFECLTLKDYIGVSTSSSNSIHDLSIFKYQRKLNPIPTTLGIILPAIVLAASLLVTTLQRLYS